MLRLAQTQSGCMYALTNRCTQKQSKNKVTTLSEDNLQAGFRVPTKMRNQNSPTFP